MKSINLGVAIAVLASSSAVLAQNTGLHALAAGAGKFFGAATDTTNFDDAAYMRILNNTSEFGLLVPENSMKWGSIQPRPGALNFANPDRVHRLAIGNQQQFRCHTLVWHQQLPSFVENGNWTRQTLTTALQTYITSVVTHFKGQCSSWDVVNEALNENGTFRRSVFFRVLGTDYIPIAFKAAAAADPTAKLFYNDFNLEFGQNKTAGALDIVRLIRAAGARVDGVGFQAHMTTGQTPSRGRMGEVLSRFTALDLDVILTELDVRISKMPPSAESLEMQATDYVSMVGACLDVARCKGVVLWQFTDKYSWVPSTFPGAGAACLFDENMQKRPAYASVASALAAGPTRLASNSTNSSVNANAPSRAPYVPGSGASQLPVIQGLFPTLLALAAFAMV